MGRFFFGEYMMLKRSFRIFQAAVAIPLLWFLPLVFPAHASGTIPFSLSQQLDTSGKPLAGCLFYSIQAGTTSTPQNAYQDSALTIPLPNPQTCDAAGRLPQMFFADGTIKVRLTDKNGVTQVVADNIQVIGASSGSGGGGTVDATTVLATGDIKVKYSTGTLSGFVRANGRTIGSATSGATERANSDTQALFEYLWGADANLTVSGGRGASANADWTANKTIALPDWRGRSISGLDDMGNTPAGLLTSSYFGTDGTVLGAAGGNEYQALAATNIPSITSTNPSQAISVTTTQSGIPYNTANSGNTGSGGTSNGPYFPGSISINKLDSTGNNSISVTSTGTNATAFRAMGPRRLLTIYIKL